MKFLKTIFSGVLIATAVSTQVAMDGPKLAIDCYNIKTPEALINVLRYHELIDNGFDANKDWQNLSNHIKRVVTNDDLSLQSILDAYTRINREKALVTPDGFSVPVSQLSTIQCLANWITRNKSKSVGIGIMTLGAIDAVQAYARVDKTIWKDTDLTGKLELLRRKMICGKMGCQIYRFLKSNCG